MDSDFGHQAYDGLILYTDWISDDRGFWYGSSVHALFHRFPSLCVSIFLHLLSLGMGAHLLLSAVAKPEDRPKASALVCFFQIWSATVSVSASEAIYANFFKNGVSKIAGVNAAEIVESGVSEFRNVVEAEYLPAVM